MKKVTIEGVTVNKDFAKLIVLHEKPSLAKLIEVCKVYYRLPNNSMGGNLHIVLDDCNIENHWIEDCLDACKDTEDNEGILLCKMLLSTPMKMRETLVSTSFRDYILLP